MNSAIRFGVVVSILRMTNSLFVKLILSFIITIFLNNKLNSQIVKTNFDRITLKDGLSQSTGGYMIQDKKGFLWVATFGGLNRYDGYSFKTYKHDDNDSTSLNHDGAIFLFEDNEGYIWIVNNSNAGLDKYDPITDKFVNYKNNPDDESSISSDAIYYVMQDKLGNIWACANNALNLIVKDKNGKKPVKFIRYYYPTNTNNFSLIYEDKNNNLLIISNQLFIFNRKTRTFQDAELSLDITLTTSAVEDKNGDILIGTVENGIKKISFDKRNSRYIELPIETYNIAPTDRIFLIKDEFQNIWIGSRTKGLYKYNQDKGMLTHFPSNSCDIRSISENSIQSLFIDRSGVLWVGTFSQGLCKTDLYRKEFEHYKSIPGNPNSLSGNLISALHSISPDELWVGVQQDGGVSRYIFYEDREPRVIQYKYDPNNQNTIGANFTICLVQRKNGDVWLGSVGGTISRIIPEDPESGIPEKIVRYPIVGWTFSIFEDSEGIIWGGTWDAGLWRYNDNSEEFVYYRNDPDNSNSLVDNIVWAIGEDHNKNIWIGGNAKGISILPYTQKNKMKPEFINFKFDKSNPKSISNNTINVFYQDKKGTMWIGTNDGLNRVIDSKNAIDNIDTAQNFEFFSYNVKDGLPSPSIVGILEDEKGNLWLSTSNGLSKFDFSDSTFTNYSESDGLQSNEFWHNAYFKNSKGRLFFGGQNGFNAFYPNKIIANPFIPQLAFTDLKVLNKSVKVGEKINTDIILQKELNQMSNIVLSHKNNVFTIEFAALHYTQPTDNKYAYYLEGFEKDWIYVDNQRSATYTNLNAGKYTFRVKGSNNNGIWNETGIKMNIRVKPPWWKTWWFRISLISVIIYLIYFTIRNRQERTKKENIFLQEKIDKGESELQKQKDEIELHKKEIDKKEQFALETNWFYKGMTILSDIISKYNNDLKTMTSRILPVLIDLLEVKIGAFYIVNDSDKSSPVLELMSYYASEDTTKNKMVPVTEGYLGTCYKDRKIVIVDNIPGDYIKLKSGLGGIPMNFLILIPILYENEVKAIIEFASLEQIAPFKYKLLEKVAENLGSSIELIKMNAKMNLLVTELNTHSEELNAQKEEMLQNIEEMKATQEENEKIKIAAKKREDKIQEQLKRYVEMENEYNELKKKYNNLA